LHEVCAELLHQRIGSAVLEFQPGNEGLTQIERRKLLGKIPIQQRVWCNLSLGKKDFLPIATTAEYRVNLSTKLDCEISNDSSKFSNSIRMSIV